LGMLVANYNRNFARDGTNLERICGNQLYGSFPIDNGPTLRILLRNIELSLAFLILTLLVALTSNCRNPKKYRFRPFWDHRHEESMPQFPPTRH
jgi:hypothetical protein